MPCPPDLEFAFVRSHNRIMELITVARDLVENGFLVPEYHGTDSRESRRHKVDLGPNIAGIQLVMAPRLRSGTDNAHLPDKDVGELRQLVDLRLSQELSHGEYSGIIFLGEDAPRKIGTVLEHRHELEDIEVLAALAHPGLCVEDIMLTGKLKPYHDGQHEGEKEEHCDEGKNDIEKANQHRPS